MEDVCFLNASCNAPQQQVVQRWSLDKSLASLDEDVSVCESMNGSPAMEA